MFSLRFLSFAAVSLILAACAKAPASESAATGMADKPTAPLFSDLGDHQHPISTKVPEAQRYFDQGLILTYAFNHLEAVRSFKEAARLDENCGICWWGVALNLGPNINKPMDEADVPEAWEALQKAIALKPHANQAERDYIDALSHRYAAKPVADRGPLDRAYADAMRKLAAKYPDDLDAQTLFAESVMDTMPWDYWENPDLAKPATKEILAVLEGVMKRNPKLPGALHYYIHAVEASNEPGRAEAAADKLVNLVPGAGHLVHMPAHVFFRVGRYADASAANERAAAADESYITQCKAQGFYPAAYYPHNVHFLWAAAALEGRSEAAIGAAKKLVELMPASAAKDFPILEEFLPTLSFAYVRFGKWDEILAMKQPDTELQFSTGMWRYARARALMAKGERAKADAEAIALRALVGSAAMKQQMLASGSTAATLLDIAATLLEAEQAEARGQLEPAFALYKKAVAAQDALPYYEPPAWFLPNRQALGAALLRHKRFKDAETVYREDLARNPKNGWSLFGLAQAQKGLAQTAAAAETEQALAAAWKNADFSLTVSAY